MTTVISIFTMPQELEDLVQTLEKLKRNSTFVPETYKIKIHITMCLSDELTDWNKTFLPKSYIKDRTQEAVEKYLDWCSEVDLEFEIGNEILGCVSHRRKSLIKNVEADLFIWLDTDMFFRDDTLFYSLSSAKLLKDAGLDMFVITPQFVRQWDETWDIIVNKKYKNESFDYYKKVDIQKESLMNKSEINIVEIPSFKFAGGWFTLISKSLLNTIGVPKSFCHYGLEDTFVMVCADILKRKGRNVSQFVMENMIVGENHKSRVNQTIKSYISSKDRKEEFKQIAHQNWEKEIQNFIDSVKV